MNIGNVYYIDKSNIETGFKAVVIVVSHTKLVDLVDFGGLNELSLYGYSSYEPNPDFIYPPEAHTDSECTLLFNTDSRDYPDIVEKIKQKFPEYFI